MHFIAKEFYPMVDIKSQKPQSFLFSKSIYISGCLTLIIGFFVLYGWITNNYIIIQIYKHSSPMQFNTALSFLFSGLGLIAYLRFPRLVGFLGILIILMGSLTLFEYFSRINLGLDQLFITSDLNNKLFPGRMAPNTALYLTLIGIILLLRGLQCKWENSFYLSFILSIFLIAVGIIAVMGYILNISIAYGWGHWTQMALLTAITFIIIGTGLTIYFWDTYYVKLNDKNIIFPITIIISGFLIFIFLWQYLIKNEYQKTSNVILAQGVLIQRLLITNLNSYYSIFNRMQIRYQNGGYPNFMVWQSDAKKFIEDMPAIMALSLVNNTSLTLTEKNSVYQHKEDISNLEQCIQGQTYNANKISIMTKNKNICWILPVTNNNILVILVNINYLITQLVTEVPNFSDYGLEVVNNHIIIYQHYNQAQDLKTTWETILPINFYNLNMRLIIWPNKNIILSNSSWFPIVSLFAGILVTLLLALSIHMWQTVSKSEKKLKNSENIFRNLLNTTSDGILIINKHGDAYFANKSFLRLTNYTLDELINTRVEKFMPERFRKNHVIYRENYMKSPVTRMMGVAKNLFLLTKQGDEIPVEIGLNPIILNDEKYILCSIHDMSRAKEIEKEILLQSRYIQIILDITNAISTEENFEKAMEHCLIILCTEFNWPVGHIYLVDSNDNEKLVPSKIWFTQNEKKYAPFYNQTMQTTLNYNLGLPGRVLATGNTIWVQDVLTYTNFLRHDSCLECGIHAAFAFPIKLNKKIIAIFEFFSNQILPQNNDVMNVINIISNQISRFVETQNIHEQMKHNAYYDNLTNLMNRHAFNDAATRLIAESERDQKMLAVLYIDVDYFKNINDSFGHQIGDQVLIKIAQELRNNLRMEDILGRLGGDEFVIVLADIKNKSEAHVVAQRIITQLKKPLLISNHVINTGVSIGISFYPESGNQMNELVEQADQVLINAKRNR